MPTTCQRLERAYLLRCWWEGSDEQGGWRFSVERIGASERRQGFADLERLLTYLRDEMMERQAEAESRPSPPAGDF